MNKGLKQYNKFITKEIGSAKAYINLAKTSNNVHLILPLIKTKGNAPFDLSLIYNYQDRNVSGIFGNGIKLSLYNKLSVSESSATIKNADGSSDSYTLDVMNNETGLTIKKNASNNYEVRDKYDNVMVYESLSEYPKTINKANGDKYNLDFISATKTITNNYNEKIRFNQVNGKVTSIIYSLNNSDYINIDLTYNGDKLSTITYKEFGKEVAKILISYTDTLITLKDNTTKVGLKCEITNNLVTKISDLYNETAQLKYELSYLSDYITKVYNLLNKLNSYVIYRESDSILLSEIDDFGNVRALEYNEFKQLKEASNGINIKDATNNILGSTDVGKFSNNGLTKTNITINNEVVNKHITNAYRFSGTGKLTKSININSIDTDTYTSVSILKLISGSATVKLGGQTKELKVSSDYQIVVVGYNETSSSNSINVEFELTNASLEIGFVMVLKKEFGNFYEYDNDGNVEKVITGSTSNDITYDSSNKPKETLSKDSTNYKVSYDSNDNVKEISSAYGVKITNTYDSNYKNNLIKSITKDRNETKVLELRKIYDNNGKFVKGEYDELENKTSYIYDELGKVKQVVDVLGHITNVNYYDDGNLKEIISGNMKATYTYENGRIKTITLANGSVYDFNYDDKFNVTEIKLNNISILNYEYDEFSNLIKQKYGNEYYEFVYDNNKLITEIIYHKQNGTKTAYHYEYDACKRVKKITLDGTLREEYTYDANGNVKEFKTNDSNVLGIYDDLGNLTIETRKVDGKNLTQTYDSISRSKGSHPEILENIYNNDSDIKFAKFSYDSTYFKNYDGIIPYLKNTSTTKYKVNASTTDSYVDNSGFISFWFRPNSYNVSSILFSCKKDNASDYIEVKYDYGYLSLSVIDDSNVSHNLGKIKYKANLNKWNFFALNFMNRYDGQGYDDVCEYNLYLNAQLLKYQKKNPRLYVSTGVNPDYCIGWSESSSFYFSGDITAIIVAKHQYLKSSDVLKIYRTTKDYLVDNEIVDVNGVDFSESSILETTKLDDLVPLQNSVTSLKGTRPIEFKRRSLSGKDKDRTFNLNKESKHYAYVADGGNLVYDINLGSSWTIMARVYTDTKTDKQYIFDVVDDNNEGIGLYRGSNNELMINVCGSNFGAVYGLLNDSFTTIGLSYKVALNSDSVDSYDITIRVFVNGHIKEINLSNMSRLTFNKLYIGKSATYTRTISNFGTFNDYHPLYGQIEMLGIKHAYCEESTVNELANELNALTKINLYDDFGMLKKKEFINKDKEILSNSYTYKTRSNTKYISKQVAKEVIKTNGNILTTRNYTLDKLGNVTGISDSYFGNKTYGYNINGFLTKVGDVDYSYDNNGNILNIFKTTTTTTKYFETYIGPNGEVIKKPVINKETKTDVYSSYTYDSTIKDRLVKVNDKTITYDSNNPLNPISYNGNTYEYEGRRLIKFNNVKYTYDLEGKRIKKDNNGNITNYYYSGDRLITEINNSYRLDYIYDENSQLIGFIHDSNKYLYIRDVLQNILGIVDINGNVVVKYDCDAFGKINNITGSKADSLGRYNPFRYKGYYYDEESKMYYCKSRYYVPEWGRWLNADSPSFLETTSVTKLNLFTYCGNNPIMNVDYNGNLGMFAVWLIGVAVSTVISLVTEVIEDLSEDGKFGGNKDFNDYAGAVVGGAIGGAGKGFIGGVVTGFAGSVVDGWISGDLNNNNYQEYLIDSAIGSIVTSSIGVGTEKLTLRAKSQSFINMKGKVKNSQINKKLKPISGGLNIGAKKATNSGIAKSIEEAEKWHKHRFAGMAVSGIFSLISSLF